MAGRRLPAFALPLRHRRWQLLSFDGERWHLLARAAPHAAQALDRVQIALELPGRRWLRLQWAGPGWRRWWPHELHLWVSEAEHAGVWPLIGAALSLHHGRPWLGR